MRASAIVLVVMILAAPAAGALVPKAPAADVAAAAAFDPSDAELLRLLAREIGLTPDTLPLPQPALAADLPGLVQAMGARLGTPLSDADVAAFGTLDPLVAAPVATMLVAMDQAWTIRDAAFQDVPPDELEAARRALIAGENVAPMLAPDEQEMLVASAIMLMDTLDTLVIPQLQALSGLPVWPPVAIADPAGVLFVGSAGDDVDTVGRMLSIDGGGSDEYRNFIGGANVEPDGNPIRAPGIAIGLDLAGNDRYLVPRTWHTALGAAFAGVGIMKEMAGNDYYSCSNVCVGAASAGIGLFREVGGSDTFDVGAECLGAVSTGVIAVARDDSGDDAHLATSACFASGWAEGIALYWDRAGTENFTLRAPNLGTFGFARGNSKAWMVNDGGEVESYRSILEPELFPGRCNDCVWKDGRDSAGGRGNDNHGGLPFLLAKQDAL